MSDRVEVDLQPVRWDRSLWEEGGGDCTPIVFLFEFNAEGAVLRQVELAGPEQVPIAAASAAEWWEAQGWTRQAMTPHGMRYEETYGGLAEGSLHDWGSDYPGQQITRDEFERVWAEARRRLGAG